MKALDTGEFKAAGAGKQEPAREPAVDTGALWRHVGILASGAFIIWLRFVLLRGARAIISLSPSEAGNSKRHLGGSGGRKARVEVLGYIVFASLIVAVCQGLMAKTSRLVS